MSQVYSWGHRNPQRIDWHPVSGDLWATEHGNIGNDELNRIEAGVNYGWPEIGGDQMMVGMRPPIFFFTPSVAPSGGLFYTGRLFPSFRNGFFFGTLRGTHLHHANFSTSDPAVVVSAERLLEGEFGRIRDVVADRTAPYTSAPTTPMGAGSPFLTTTGSFALFR